MLLQRPGSKRLLATILCYFSPWFRKAFKNKFSVVSLQELLSSNFRGLGARYEVLGLGFEVLGLGFEVSGPGFEVLCLG